MGFNILHAPQPHLNCTWCKQTLYQGEDSIYTYLGYNFCCTDCKRDWIEDRDEHEAEINDTDPPYEHLPVDDH